MAEEVIIQVTTETDAAQLEELDSLVEEIRDKATIDASVEVEDTSLDEASDKATTLEDELTNIDNTVVSPQVDTSGLEEASGKAEETASSMDNITTAAAGLAATAGVEQMVTTADNINNSWNRLDLTLGSAGVSMDTVKSQVNSLSASTGRSGGVIRDYFNQMGIAGVTNTDLLSSSFEALAGKAYQTEGDINTMQSTLQKMAMSGMATRRNVSQLGITMDDLGTAMGMTGASATEVSKAFQQLTPEERIAAITKAMGDGTQANEMYKNSYAGLKERADAAMAGLMGAIGQAILPVVIPALQAATNAIKFLTDGFKNLPGPVQSIIGAVGGFIAVGTAAVGVMGVIGNVIGSVIGGFRSLRDAANLIGLADKLSPLKDALVTVASTAKTAALELLSAGKSALLAGANAVKSAALWAIENGMKILSTGASYALAAAQAILNAVMSMNPIMLVVLAIAALVAALIWAYQNVDWFRAMVDNAWQSLMQIGQYIYGVLAGAVQWLGSLFQSFTSQLGLNTQDWIQAIIGFILFLPQLPLKVGIALTNALAKALGFKGNFVQSLISSASSAVSGFVSYITQLPGIVMGEFNRVLGLVNDFINSLPDRVWDMGQAIIDALKRSLGIGSPGHMFYMMEGELERIEDLPEDMQSGITRNVRYLGEGIVDSFHPNLNGTLNGNVASGSYGNTINLNLEIGSVDNEERVREIIDVIRRELNWNNKTAGRGV